jgi:hypothetical protein
MCENNLEVFLWYMKSLLIPWLAGSFRNYCSLQGSTLIDALGGQSIQSKQTKLPDTNLITGLTDFKKKKIYVDSYFLIKCLYEPCSSVLHIFLTQNKCHRLYFCLNIYFLNYVVQLDHDCKGRTKWVGLQIYVTRA